MTAQRTPAVSVVIPTYDRLPLLGEAVASVRAQTFPDWELIVVDDGSADGTAAWVSSLDDPRVRLVSLPHSGDLASLRNEGVRRARGRYVAFLDSDDVWEPEKLAVQLSALEREGDARWSYTAMSRIDAQGERFEDPRVPAWRGSSGWIIGDLLSFRAVVDTPTVLVERALVEEVGGFDPGMGSWVTDYDLIFRLGLAAPAVAVDRPLTRIRVHAGAHSADRAAAHGGWAALYTVFAERVDDPSLARLCEREARRHRLHRASRLCRAGRRREAWAEVVPVLARRPWSAHAWRVLLWHLIGTGLLRTRRNTG